jgi:hypothetical protein
MTLTVCLGDSPREPALVALAGLHVCCAPIHVRERLVAIVGFAGADARGCEARSALLLQTIVGMAQMRARNAMWPPRPQDNEARDRI